MLQNKTKLLTVQIQLYKYFQNQFFQNRFSQWNKSNHKSKKDIDDDDVNQGTISDIGNSNKYHKTRFDNLKLAQNWSLIIRNDLTNVKSLHNLNGKVSKTVNQANNSNFEDQITCNKINYSLNSISSLDQSINSPRFTSSQLSPLNINVNDNLNLSLNNNSVQSPVLSFVSNRNDHSKLSFISNQNNDNQSKKIKHRFITLSPDLTNKKIRSKSCSNEENFRDLKNNLSHYQNSSNEQNQFSSSIEPNQERKKNFIDVITRNRIFINKNLQKSEIKQLKHIETEAKYSFKDKYDRKFFNDKKSSPIRINKQSKNMQSDNSDEKYVKNEILIKSDLKSIDLLSSIDPDKENSRDINQINNRQLRLKIVNSENDLKLPSIKSKLLIQNDCMIKNNQFDNSQNLKNMSETQMRNFEIKLLKTKHSSKILKKNGVI